MHSNIHPWLDVNRTDNAAFRIRCICVNSHTGYQSGEANPPILTALVAFQGIERRVLAIVNFMLRKKQRRAICESDGSGCICPFPSIFATTLNMHNIIMFAFTTQLGSSDSSGWNATGILQKVRRSSPEFVWAED
jgi:hypothetical protein